MTIKQVQAVINAVEDVLGEDFVAGETNALEVLTKEQKSAVQEIVLNGVLNGSVTFSKSTDDVEEVKRYVNGMVDNHLRRSKVLNGGTTYKSSGKGSKKDPQLRELNKLLNTLEPGTEKYNQVQQHISARQTQIQAERTQRQAAQVRASIDTSVLPENLANMLGS